MRSFRAEHLSRFVQLLLERDIDAARRAHLSVRDQYPIRLTRNLGAAKAWLRANARGSERFGLVASSRAERLKPHAVYVRAPVNPVHWFLNEKEDVRSSYYLEDAATEFHIQGLEVDWSCVVWDGDLRFGADGWSHNAFRGRRWIRVRQPERRRFLENAYRVLLTRARQGMVIVIPEGDDADPTRSAAYYDPTFEYLRDVGIRPLE